MIYSYNKILHTITGFHDSICYIFEKIFDLDLENYDEAKLVEPSFLPIIKASPVRLETPLKKIVEVYHSLPLAAKIQLKYIYEVNNDITSLSDKTKDLGKYNAIHPNISKLIKDFFTTLWEDYPIVNQIELDFGTVKSHYDALVDPSNCKAFVCPFCGTETFLSSKGKYREAYDHLLAKSEYPFISVNFEFIFPMCHRCNSTEKGVVDPLYSKDGLRITAYNPYDDRINKYPLELNFVLNEAYNKAKLETLLKSISWDLEFKRNGIKDEELISWNVVFGIERRYLEFIDKLEKEWFFQLEKIYKRELKKGTSFNTFKGELMDDAKDQILIVPLGILKYSYFNFIFSTKNFQARLNETINK